MDKLNELAVFVAVVQQRNLAADARKLQRSAQAKRHCASVFYQVYDDLQTGVLSELLAQYRPPAVPVQLELGEDCLLINSKGQELNDGSVLTGGVAVVQYLADLKSNRLLLAQAA